MKKIQSIKIIFLVAMISSQLKYCTHANAITESTLPYKAIIHHPVIDMNCSGPITNSLCVSPGTNKDCNRSHQGLYNELVTCIEEKDEFIKIIFRTIKYNLNGSLSYFWTEKKNVIPLKKLNQKIISQAIPHHEYGQEGTIVLTYPWKHFSVGTRFKHIPENDTKNSYGIVKGDYEKNKIIYDTIPHGNAIKEKKQSTQSSRKLFVKIINDLVSRVDRNNNQQVIPYVWGGGSFVDTYPDKIFHQDNQGAWQRNNTNKLYTGYDCSEFVMKMAQIAGLDFPWKTTTAIQRSKRKLTENDRLENGDLIWFNGHVMIVSNILKNEVIEARGYPSNYGRVHKIKLPELFEDIKSYDDLCAHYHAKKPLNLKNKDGKLFKKIDSFLLLKLID